MMRSSAGFCAYTRTWRRIARKVPTKMSRLVNPTERPYAARSALSSAADAADSSASAAPPCGRGTPA